MKTENPFKELEIDATYDSPLLFMLSKQAAARCDGKGDFDAITAIIMAYASLEAFINEIYQTSKALISNGEASEIESIAISKFESTIDPHLTGC